MPRAEHLAPVTLIDCGVPSPANPLGAKGAGEAGATGAIPALANAVLDALKPFRKKRIPLGTKITVTVTVPGQIGKRFQYTMRKGKIPKKQLRCISPDGKISTCS